MKLAKRILRALTYLTIAVAVAGCALLFSAQGLLIDAARPYVFEESQAPKAYVAIVLGAGVNDSGVPGAVLADRLESARRLYESGHVAKILVSGDNDGDGIDEVNPMRDWLVSRGVPSEAVYMDHAGFRTLDTMQRARWVFGVENAIVCTQDFHVHRAVYLARNAGIAAVGVPSREQRWRVNLKARGREFLARAMAVLDANVGTAPRHLGQRIPIASAPAEETHDHNTVIHPRAAGAS